MELSTGDLARVFGITPRQVQSLATQGVLIKSGHGAWDLERNVPAWVAHRVKSEVTKVARSPVEERLAAAKADALELKIERESRALVIEAVQEAEATFDILAGGLRSDMLAVPAQVTNDLAFRRKIEVAIDAAFQKAADRARKAADAEEAEAAKQPANRKACRAGARRAGR